MGSRQCCRRHIVALVRRIDYLCRMNSDVIRLLPDSVANQIAAGEVIQRPASVIKELVENAVDAGATDISIILKDAGRTLIQVVDNGCGMTPTDARMAFERHATSKIASAADLFSLHTMGFRGEALPSIAAVAQIDLRTMQKGESVGTRLLINESKFEGQEPCTCVPGTNLMVKNLFFHMPARRKFLKKDSIELSHILHEFERLALVNTNIAFTLIHNDVTLHRFGPGNLKQRIGSLFGKNLEQQLLHFETETALVKIEGFTLFPRFARKRGYQQFMFVNGRNMRHLFFHKAVMKCYEQLISPDTQPSYFINFTVDPATIDVNIHPQKHEIKFEHEQAIWQILEATIREILGKSQAGSTLDFDSDAPDIPLFNPDANIAAPSDDFDPDFNPFRAASDNHDAGTWQPAPTYEHRKNVSSDWQKLYDSFARRRDDAFTEAGAEADMTDLVESRDCTLLSDDSIIEKAPACFQLQNRYIICSSKQGLMIISQHRAHTRILFERFMTRLSEGPLSSQILIFPEDFELSAARAAILQTYSKEFSDLGFAVEKKDDMTWNLTAAPIQLHDAAPSDTLITMIDDIAETENPDPAMIHRPLALSMARSAAIKPAQPLSVADMDSIVADLSRCSEPSITPDGLPIVIIVNNEEIVQRFATR